MADVEAVGSRLGSAAWPASADAGSGCDDDVGDLLTLDTVFKVSRADKKRGLIRCDCHRHSY